MPLIKKKYERRKQAVDIFKSLYGKKPTKSTTTKQLTKQNK
jgi:hypothetical protein